MLAKVKGVQWCSNAAKLHYNELSFSSRENRRKHDFREDQKNSFTVIVSLKGRKVAEITTDTGNNLLFRTSFKHLAKQDLAKCCTFIAELMFWWLSLEKSPCQLVESIPEGILEARQRHTTVSTNLWMHFFYASPYYWLTNPLGSLALLFFGSLDTIT